MNNSTINYYQNNATDLITRYESADVCSLQETLLKTFVSNTALLEIGCGSGRDASFLYKHGYKLTAVDASTKMIEAVKVHHPELAHSLHVKEVPEELDFEDRCFDGVYSIATLMHMTEPDIIKTINKVYSILKPGGRFLFSVSIQRDDTNNNGFDNKGRRFTTLPKATWSQFCENAGLIVIAKEVTGDGLDRSGIHWLTMVAEKHN